MGYKIEKDGIAVTVDTFTEFTVALVVMGHDQQAIDPETWNRLRLMDKRDKLTKDTSDKAGN